MQPVLQHSIAYIWLSMCEYENELTCCWRWCVSVVLQGAFVACCLYRTVRSGVPTCCVISFISRAWAPTEGVTLLFPPLAYQLRTSPSSRITQFSQPSFSLLDVPHIVTFHLDKMPLDVEAFVHNNMPVSTTPSFQK